MQYFLSLGDKKNHIYMIPQNTKVDSGIQILNMPLAGSKGWGFLDEALTVNFGVKRTK